MRASLYGLACAAALLARPAAAQSVLKITRVPADTPPADTLFVAGSFNGWNPHSAAHALTRAADGSYQISLPATLGLVEYKFTRGSWATGEAGANQQPLANRRADLAQTPLVLHQVAAWSAPAAPRKHTASAQVRVLSQAFAMPELGRTRRVLVYLPADYARQPQRRYPVLYLHDGQNVFDEATSFSGEWGVDETLDRLRQTGQDASGSIVVAIDNDSQHRADEYIPWRNAEVKGGGQGGQYVDFLAKTLKPYVDAHYRTRPDAAHTGIAGSSLGGLISVYAALKYPRVFGRVGAFSPAFWVCNDSLRAYAKTHPAARTARFYFVCGPKESETMLPLMTQWRDELRAEGVPAANLAFSAPANGEHREWFWRREFPAAYRFLFGLKALPDSPGVHQR
ncbi:alpha/beta hydrolase [Hymenobacter ruricola]|uniref:Alpha/beta hydrolase n=1 Tax=Hymenobacter ruricola TaxID=2791023 RepID=A0ABS0I5X0_9BACT|nr:alpha/beta hydrolase-fold protein [Hymenobacter ruricola]MBF9222345.1 alpha/beta hydrolase [Hymenobacter ruricola]